MVRNWLLILPFSLVFVFMMSVLDAQKASFRKYSVLDGLPQSQVTNIFQDSRGYIWISTRNGLSRFDGIEFINYFRTNGLPDNQVFNIFEDNVRNLWTLSQHGLSKYNGYGFDFFPTPPEFRKWLFVNPPSVDTANNIFLLGENPEAKFRRIIIFRDGLYKDYSKSYPVLDTFKVRELLFDKLTGGFLLLDQSDRTWIWKDELLSMVSTRKFQRIFLQNDQVMASANDSIFSYTENTFKTIDLTSSARRYGVIKNSKLEDIQFEISNRNESYKIDLPFDFLTYWLDNENVIWFSSEGNMYRLLSSAFTNFYDEDIGSGTIWALAEDRNGHIFFGSLYNSLIEFDGKAFRERNEFRSLFKNQVSFYKGSRRMSNGDVWFSTNSGVLVWNGSAFSVLKGIPGNAQICYIYEDPDNKNVMLGTEQGLFIVRNNEIEVLKDFNDSRLGVIEGIAKDDSGNYWLSGHNGVVKYDGKNTVVIKESILPEEYTYTIVKDDSGGLWVTSETGLYFRRKSADKFIHGLPENLNSPANSIIRMDSNQILVGRVSDICIIDLKKFYANDRNYFRMYDNTDGFMGSDCLDNGIIRDQSGRYWILTSDKTVIFDPSKLEKNPNPPKLNITGFHFETDSLTWLAVDKSNFFYRIPDNIRLVNSRNKIQISFNAISTRNPEKVKLQYRLEGYDEKWSLPSGKRYVVYEKLPQGHYRFHLKAFNADGVETLKPLDVNITVVPTLWQRDLFRIAIYLSGALIVILLSLYLIRRSVHKKEEEAKLRNELSRLQMNSVLKQFDPHFTFNVISAIGSLIMKGEKESAYDYITILGGLLRTVLGEGSVIIKPLSDEIDFVRRYCELQKLRFKDRINFSLIIDKEVDLRRNIPKMTIQLFVENAIKHGFEDRIDGGQVDVRIHKNNQSLEIVIIDNGIGRVAAARQATEGSGNGLKMITGLFDAMNAHNNSLSTIEISDLEENGYATGTRVKIVIPDDYKFEFGNSIPI